MSDDIARYNMASSKPAFVATLRSGEEGANWLRVVCGLVLSLAVMLLGLWIAGTTDDAYLTLVASGLGGFLAIWFGAYLFGFPMASRATMLLLLAFAIRFLAGIFHYLLVMDPEYFQHSSQYDYFWDYASLHENMVLLADTWNTFGFGVLPEQIVDENKNATMTTYSGLVYYLGGIHVLHIASWNSFHALLAALLLGAAARNIGYSGSLARRITLLAAFYPFGLLSSVMWRDNVGLSWVALAVYAISAARGISATLGVTAVAALLAGAHRSIYAPVTTLVPILFLAWSKSSTVRIFRIAIFVLIPTAIAIFYGQSQIIVENLDSQLAAQEVASKALFLPLRILRAVAGPFPWTQAFHMPVGVEYLPLDFVLACINFAVMISAGRMALRYASKGTGLEPMFGVGVAYLACAILSFGVHMTYTVVGVFFMIPIAQVEMKFLKRALVCSIFVFLLANLAYYVAGLEGSGLVLNITGY